MNAEKIKIGERDTAFFRDKETLLGDALSACVKALSIAHRHLPCECGADWEQVYWDAIAKARESLSRAATST
jgi:hypothetical protein